MNKKILAVIVVGILLLGGGIFLAHNGNGNPFRKTFSTSTQGLPEAKPSSLVELKNGDTYNLTASIVKKVIAGNEVKMLAYNGSIPGPTIKVPQGAEITVHFTNNTDTPTTIHSHGVRLDNAFDGVPNVTQKEVGIGESFVYKIKFPDAGVYWYHPHIREDYAQELGLYGNYIVTPSDPTYWSPVNREVPLVVDDILIKNGTTAPFGAVADHALMGRFGNVMLVNGSDAYTLSIQQGEVIRFYITNTANTRVFNLAIPGAKIKLVGGDNGKYERETFVDRILIASSERAVVDVLFATPGAYTLQHITPEKTYVMGELHVAPGKVTPSYQSQFFTLRTNRDTVASIDPFRQDFDRKDDKNLALSVAMGGMGMSGGAQTSTMATKNMGGNSNGKIEWEDGMSAMNGMADANMVKWNIIDRDTGKIDNEINWKFKVGDKVKIKIYNDPNAMHPMQHPIHFHGQRFLVLTTNGVKNTNMVWKDTTLIQKGDTVEILVDMENPGTWMAHCHIAEHLESGMMFNFIVE
ncbi:MAG: multicopper oxidase family protein [Minisyncoccota bacterium]